MDSSATLLKTGRAKESTKIKKRTYFPPWIMRVLLTLRNQKINATSLFPRIETMTNGHNGYPILKTQKLKRSATLNETTKDTKPSFMIWFRNQSL
jgi:hypothetical protein